MMDECLKCGKTFLREDLCNMSEKGYLCYGKCLPKFDKLLNKIGKETPKLSWSEVWHNTLIIFLNIVEIVEIVEPEKVIFT